MWIIIEGGKKSQLSSGIISTSVYAFELDMAGKIRRCPREAKSAFQSQEEMFFWPVLPSWGLITRPLGCCFDASLPLDVLEL